MTDYFRDVRERVSAEDAARFYGLTFDRRNLALCPFHRDTRPSMSFYKGRFRCWACNASGDSIDLVERLLGLDNMGAVRRLNADFHLALPLDRPPTAADQRAAQRRWEIAEAHRAFEAWRADMLRQLNAVCRIAHESLQALPDPLTDRQAAAVRFQAQAEYYADTLEAGAPEEQAQIYRDREAMARWIDRILKG